MARIEGEILIGRPVREVFDFVADSRNEPSFNPAMTGVDLLTALPIGRGTRFCARMGRAGTQMLVELTEFDPPHRLGSRTTSSMMQTSGALTFAADGNGTVMSWDWQVRAKGLDEDARPAGRATRPTHGTQNLDQHEAVPGGHRDPARTLARSRQASPDVLGEKARTRCHESARCLGLDASVRFRVTGLLVRCCV